MLLAAELAQTAPPRRPELLNFKENSKFPFRFLNLEVLQHSAEQDICRYAFGNKPRNYRAAC